MFIGILTGFTAGAFHVLSGADHLAAMAPSSIKKPSIALRNSLSWGIGHSSGVLALSAIAIFIKDLAPLNKISTISEFFVGISLLLVGVVAIKNSFSLNVHSHDHSHQDGSQHRHIHLHYSGKNNKKRHNHALTSMGMLHGLAGGSHLIAVFPALALPPITALIYMISYLFGSIVIMSLFVLMISFATSKVGRIWFSSLIFCTGGISIVTGIIWLQGNNLFTV
tara:strand:+ start:9118 stop:9786 length:669 start_codon:yes stop_codon:yes gene_type:complete